MKYMFVVNIITITICPKIYCLFSSFLNICHSKHVINQQTFNNLYQRHQNRSNSKMNFILTIWPYLQDLFLYLHVEIEAQLFL